MKKVRILFIISIIILGGVLFFGGDLMDLYYQFSLKLPQFEKEITGVLTQEIEKQISTPPPLRAEKEDLSAYLTRSKVIYWTNFQREEFGLPPLKENIKLNAAAAIKVEDMFQNQYFTHISPSGEGVGDLAKIVKYEFIIIGENLALGNFKDDSTLVQAWMESPGHRENILNPNYQEIGVAVEKGVFEGKTTWMAVQHFGLPLSTCPQPDEALQEEISIKESEINQLEKTLKSLQVEIRNIRPKRGTLYNQKIEEYNSLVSEYNILIKETEILINEYNTQIKLFNECITGIK